MSNKYLEKIALRRIISEIAKGTVKTPLKDLASKGFVKLEKVYSKGMAEGNRNIAKNINAHIGTARSNTPVRKLLSDMGGGYAGFLDKKNKVQVIRKALPRNKQNNIHQGFTRHELFEGMDMRAVSGNNARVTPKPLKGTDQYNTAVTLASMEIPGGKRAAVKLIDDVRTPKPDVFLSGDNMVGAHMTPRVLTRESEMARKNPYLKKITEIRNLTGEASYVKKLTGKKFGVDKMNSKDHARAFNESKRLNVYQSGTLNEGVNAVHGLRQYKNFPERVEKIKRIIKKT
jgi:hypothetical protein